MLDRLFSRASRIATLIDWSVALFGFWLQVPAIRIDRTHFSIAQLKIMQEAITLIVLVPFALIFLEQPFKLD